MTKGALYWHFKSKEALLKRIIEEFEKKYLRYNAAFSYYNQELCVSYTTLAAELAGAHHGTEPHPDLAALIIIALHDGILIRWFMNQNEIDGEAYVKTFKKIMLQGLMI